MHIVHIGSEVAPIAKAGGLADVMLGLSAELHHQGHTVDILLPKYDCLIAKELIRTDESIKSYFQGQWHTNSIWRTPLTDGLFITFIDPHHARRFFQRGAIYGFLDDIDRFAYFARASLDILKAKNIVPDVIHIHDWMVAPVAFLLRQGDFKDHFSKTKVVLTIHNIEYQGRCSPHHLEDMGYKGPVESIKEPQGSSINFLRGGIAFADAVTTVSPTYSQEVMTEWGAKGLLDVLKVNKDKFFGILNGLDNDYWNPEKDQFIEYSYSIKTLSKKIENKRALYKALGLTFSSKPLIACVTRLVPQKGVALIKHAMLRAKEWQAQFILVGSVYDPETQEEFTELQQQFQKDPDIRIILKNEEKLAHQVFAASDMLIVPSIFEPCGLTQMIALKYGSIPIVRKTGGLADTVFDIEYSDRSFEKTNGFTFDHADTGGVDFALQRAVNLFYNDKKRWKQLMEQGMGQDLSWAIPAELYLKLYQ